MSMQKKKAEEAAKEAAKLAKMNKDQKDEYERKQLEKRAGAITLRKTIK
ncbi:capsid assembly scaffolding protein Gp46 family protein [Staphylococcus aureus]